MSTLYRLIFVSFFITFSAVSTAETGYVSDEVYTYLHTGPSAKFRILGSIKAGAPITILEKSEDQKYTKVSDLKGREGWVMSEFISTQESLKQKYAALQLSLDNQLASNEDLTRETSTVKEKTSQLQQEIDALTSQLAKAKNDITDVEAQLTGEDHEIKIQWFTRGGLLVLFSFLIGVVVSSLFSKKKSKSNWA